MVRRFWMASTGGEIVKTGEVTQRMLDAIDVLTADGMDLKLAADWVRKTTKAGLDPLGTARMLAEKRAMARRVMRER